MFSTQEEEVWWRDVGDKAAPNLEPNSCGTVHLAQVSRAPAEKQRLALFLLQKWTPYWWGPLLEQYDHAVYEGATIGVSRDVLGGRKVVPIARWPGLFVLDSGECGLERDPDPPLESAILVFLVMALHTNYERLQEMVICSEQDYHI